MTSDSRKQQWALVSIVLVCGCQIGVEQLEVGEPGTDTEDDGETEAPGDGDGDGDGDGLATDECWALGTNLDGDPDPLDFPLPECEVECAGGWGHGVGLLPIAWTLDLEHEGDSTRFVHLEQMPGGEVLAFFGRRDFAQMMDEPARLVFISPDGEIVDDVERPEIGMKIWDVGVDGSGTIYALWDDEDVQSLTAMSSTGEHLWTIDLGPQQVHSSVLAARHEEVIVALNPADEFGVSELLVIPAAGQPVLSKGPIPFTDKIALSPGGATIVLANNTSITWVDYDWGPTSNGTQGVAGVSFVQGLVTLDQARVVAVGMSPNYDEGGALQGYVHEVGPMGLAWEHHYDRALAWCPGDETPMEDRFYDVAGLADGSLLIVGSEQAQTNVHQPWIGHVSADGDMLAMDRGFWDGSALVAMGADDGSAYALLEAYEGDQQRLLVRKYLP